MKAMMNALLNSYWKKWIRKHRCKVAGGVMSLHKRSALTLEEGVSIGHVVVESKKLAIGAHTYIRSECVLSAVSSIGRYCSIGTGCFIGQQKSSHPTDWLSSHPFQYTDTALTYDPEVADVTIGHDVWVGHSAMILEGVTVGTGAIIATRAVVAHDVPPYAIVAGIPAKVVKYRHPPELIDALLASRWWECDIEVLKKLPVNDPWATLDLLAGQHEGGQANYRRIQITRKKCSVLPG